MKKFLVIGNPIEHSLSPILHNYWINNNGIDAIYEKQKLNEELSKFYKTIEELEETGVVMKGLDQGLLDFPSKRFDEEVWLCWKEGETEIKFWHEKDSGFNGRKPISVDAESLI